MRLAELTWAVSLRLLREGLLLRSLAFPALVVVAALLSTAVIIGGTARPVEVAVEEGAPPVSLPTVKVADAEAAVREGRTQLGTDGRTLWRPRGSTEALVVEAELREARGAAWQPDPVLRRPTPDDTLGLAGWMGRAIAMIYALYGVVVGTGLIVRDRDDGSLASERTLPVPSWWHALARWAGGWLVLGSGWTASLALLHAVMTVPSPMTLWAHGLAAATACVALGLGASIASQRSFSGTLAGGLTGAFLLFGAGASVPALGVLPVSSLATGGSPWLPLGGAVVLGGAACARAALSWR